VNNSQENTSSLSRRFEATVLNHGMNDWFIRWMNDIVRIGCWSTSEVVAHVTCPLLP